MPQKIHEKLFTQEYMKRKIQFRIGGNIMLNRIQYRIIKIMYENNAIDAMYSMSCNEITDIEKSNKVTTIYKHIRILEKRELVKNGAKVERANGYILTQKAIDLLPKDIKLNKERAFQKGIYHE